jgi:hypothetical protein
VQVRFFHAVTRRYRPTAPPWRRLLPCLRGLHLLLHHLRQLFLDRLPLFRRLGRQIVEFKM